MTEKIRVLMIGPGRKVMGGITSVVNSYYDLGLDKNVKLKYIASMKNGNKIFKLFVAIKAYLEFCFVLKKFDIIHIHMAAQASFTRKAFFVKRAKKKNKKILIHQHAADFDNFYFKQSNIEKQNEIKQVFGMADKIVALSDAWSNFFGENICDKSKITVLYNGVILPEYQKKDYKNHNILFLGQLGKRKGSYDLLKAIPEILKMIPDAEFYLGGNGDVEKSKEIAKNYGIEDHTHFLGWINNKDEYLKKCSTFVLPSYHEGMPMAILEAMSYGLAVVSTNVGGIPQVIENRKNGICIDAGNVEMLTKVLIELIDDTKLKRELGERASKTIYSNFNMEKNINKLYQIYKGL